MDHEQRINMKFCFKLQKSCKETQKMLILVYGDAAVTMKMVYKWFERFRYGLFIYFASVLSHLVTMDLSRFVQVEYSLIYNEHKLDTLIITT